MKIPKKINKLSDVLKIAKIDEKELKIKCLDEKEIAIPDLQKKIKIPIISMPKEVYYIQKKPVKKIQK